MSNIYEQELLKYNIFDNDLPEIVDAIVESIPSTTIPVRMKQAIAISEIVRYASQFHIHIKHWNDSIIPINSITFCIAKSGASKDSSVSAARKCFQSGYEIINQARLEEAKEKAITLAREVGLDCADEWNVYKDFYIPINPLIIGISTVEGFLLHLSELCNSSLGSGYIYSGEIGAELASNPNMVDNIKASAELYDEGNKELKALKNRANQTEVKNIATSALFMGSQDNILYDETIKRKFKTEFTTKLGRRSFFVFVNEEIIQPTFNTVEEAINHDKYIDSCAIKSRKEVDEYIANLTNELILQTNIPINVDEEVIDLFHIYSKYNHEEFLKLDGQYTISKLSRAHMQWKALKVAGAFALVMGKLSIDMESYIYAIRFTEMLSKDINLFERELAKEPYEVFTSYAKDIATNFKSKISLHTLRKLGYITGSGNPTAKMKELVQLANSYDKDATYKVVDDYIECMVIQKTTQTKVSYLPLTGSKDYRAKHCAVGYKVEDIEFKELAILLEEDFAYSQFEFLDGKRGKDNIIGGCKWLVFDIDKSEVTSKECHLLLEDINHIIVNTSNPNNDFKFRVIIELDSEIDISDIQWSYFNLLVAESLGLSIDKLPKSQIFFSYAVSKDTILTQFDGECLEVKPYLDMLHSEPQKIKLDTLSHVKKKQLLEDNVETFRYAYDAPIGRRSISLIRAAKHAKDLGASKENILELMNNINYYWITPLQEQEFNNCIIQQINRWSFNE